MREIARKIMASRRPSASAVISSVRRLMARVASNVEPIVVKDASGTTWEIANPTDHDWVSGLFAMTFGATGSSHVLVWANGVEDALEEAADYLEETGKSGHFVPEDIMRQHYEEARAELGEGADEDAVSQKAEEGLTYTESGYIPSHEWWVDDASPELVKLAKAASAAAGQGDGLQQGEQA
jgi:hypothetical protein